MIAIMFDMSALLPDTLSLRYHSLAPGQVLFRHNDRIERVYRVESGQIRLVRHLPQGSELTLQRAGAGALLAEASLFNECYHCDAVTDGATTVTSVARAALIAALCDDPPRMLAWLRVLSSEVQRLRGRSEILACKTVAARLDAWLSLHGAKPDKLTWRAVAAELAVSPEALYRELARR